MQLRPRHFRLALCLLLASSLAACGGGSSSVKDSTTTTPASIINGSNVATLTVDSGPSTLPSNQYTVNEVFTDVTICDSAAAVNCQTIDHILVDTGSTGLRIMSSVISSKLNLPSVQDASNKNIGECGMFADGYTWGPVKKATIKLADQAAPDVPIQVIGDPNFNPAPTACASTGNPENDVSSFGANGVLGIGYFLQDCGTYCVKSIPAPAIYYACTSSGCTGTTLATADQLNNPVSLFNADNNGVMLSLPPLPSNGALDVLGSLVLGVNTQSNNQLDSAQIYQVNASTGNLTTVYGGQSLTGSFIDSGSNGLYFNDSSIPGCTTATGFYCPHSTLNLSATIKSVNGTQASTISFNIANAEILFTSGNTAFSDLGGSGFNNAFDWGLPFFYGRKVFVIFEGQHVGGSTGPFIAF